MSVRNRGEGEIALIVVILFVLCLFDAVFLAGCPIYSVWHSEKAGQAELVHADYNRKIKTVEAQQVKESASMLADAEVIRAEGVAKANKIIGDSLKGNESYLHYLWINNLEKSGNQSVIYIPTEANMPIMEAGRRVK